MQSRWAIRPVCILSVLLVCGNVGSVLGQAVSGSLLGTITDASGAAVPNAQVTITEINTGIVRKAETNASGNYSSRPSKPEFTESASNTLVFEPLSSKASNYSSTPRFVQTSYCSPGR